jgi:hypothetical protein
MGSPYQEDSNLILQCSRMLTYWNWLLEWTIVSCPSLNSRRPDLLMDMAEFLAANDLDLGDKVH